MTTNSTTYTTSSYSSSGITTTTTTVVKPNIYNDMGCDADHSCGVSYTIIPKCVVDLYHGIETCQIVYVLDKNGQPLDLDRLDKIDIKLFNEFDCEVLNYGYGMYIESLQTTFSGNIVDITPDNFYDLTDKFFDLYNVKVTNDDPNLICPDDSKAIILGDSNDDIVTFGQIIFNPITYNGDLYVELKSNKDNVGEAICLVNGLPQMITLDKKNRLINILDTSKEANLSIMSVNSEFTQTILMLDEIKLYCTKGFKDKGTIKICYNAAKIPKVPGRLVAEVILTFSDLDEEEKGASHVISCIHLANVKKSKIISSVIPDDDDPNYSGPMFKVVDKLPVASWNTMNTIYLIDSKNPTENNKKIEFVTLKKKVNNGYTYYWEKLGANYDLTATQDIESEATLNLTNQDDDLDSVIIKHKNRIDGHGSMIDFGVSNGTITANITKIDGGVL